MHLYCAAHNNICSKAIKSRQTVAKLITSHRMDKHLLHSLAVTGGQVQQGWASTHHSYKMNACQGLHKPVPEVQQNWTKCSPVITEMSVCQRLHRPIPEEASPGHCLLLCSCQLYSRLALLLVAMQLGRKLWLLCFNACLDGLKPHCPRQTYARVRNQSDCMAHVELHTSVS